MAENVENVENAEVAEEVSTQSVTTGKKTSERTFTEAEYNRGMASARKSAEKERDALLAQLDAIDAESQADLDELSKDKRAKSILEALPDGMSRREKVKVLKVALGTPAEKKELPETEQGKQVSGEPKWTTRNTF